MKAVLFEVYFEGGKDQIHIDRKYQPQIMPYIDNTCAIVGKSAFREMIFARFGVNHSVVCKGEVSLKGIKNPLENVMKE
jgi:hypothetical protein